jgi:hypothetical protein
VAGVHAAAGYRGDYRGQTHIHLNLADDSLLPGENSPSRQGLISAAMGISQQESDSAGQPWLRVAVPILIAVNLRGPDLMAGHGA